jgi:hypothetical protein
MGFHLILLVTLTSSNLPMYKHLHAPEHYLLQNRYYNRDGVQTKRDRHSITGSKQVRCAIRRSWTVRWSHVGPSYYSYSAAAVPVSQGAKQNSGGVGTQSGCPATAVDNTTRCNVGKTNTVRHSRMRWEYRSDCGDNCCRACRARRWRISVEGAPKIAAMELSQCARRLLKDTGGDAGQKVWQRLRESHCWCNCNARMWTTKAAPFVLQELAA